MGPPRPRGEPECDPPPPPQPPAHMGAAKNKRAHACAPLRRTDRTQRSRVSTNRSGMGGHAPHGQHNASDARFVACPGKAKGRKEAERPPALQAPPRPHSRRKRRTPPPPSPPPSIRTPWTRPAAGSPQRDRAGPPHPQARAHNADPDSLPSGRAVGGGGAQDPRRPTQRSKAPPRGRPAAAPTSQVGGNRDRTAPPQSTPDRARDRGRTRGGARTTWNGPTSAQCRDHARCARHTNQRGGERTPRDRERTHTKGTRGDYRKGNRTERAERTDRMEWRTSERG